MKNKLMDNKNLKAMLIAGIVLVALGTVIAYMLPEEMHLATRVAGFVTGLGFSLAVMGGAVLIRRKRMGEERARDSELAMTDERGVAIAYKAQSVMAFAAVIALAIVTIAAMVRGDSFYMVLGAVLLIAVAVGKLVALRIFNKIM